MNDKCANDKDVGRYILLETAKRPEHLRKYITLSLKMDTHANMGLISDIKEELRKVNALKMN